MAETRTQEIKREVISLRDHLEELRRADREEINRRFADQEKAVNAALAAADKAVNKAEAASEKRADASNEIRQAMVDQQAAFVTKVEVSGLERRILILEDTASRAAGRSMGTASSGDILFRIIAAVASVAAILAMAYALTK